jgi:hypothetical protein
MQFNQKLTTEEKDLLKEAKRWFRPRRNCRNAKRNQTQHSHTEADSAVRRPRRQGHGALIFMQPRTDRQQQREELTAAIIVQVREAVQELFGETPADFPVEAKTSIEHELVIHTELITNAIGIEDLKSERAIRSHIEKTIVSAKYMINRVLDQRRRLQ